MAGRRAAATIDKIKIRMYRGGTGDFFILQFKAANTVRFQMMIDCGCIQGSKAHFEPRIKDLAKYTGGIIDLLVVTHEHADHINGFDIGKELFKNITFKKVWFAWTEDDRDPVANDLRKNHSELDNAIKFASSKLTELKEKKFYEGMLKNEEDAAFMIEGRHHFIDALTGLNSLNIINGLAAKKGKVKPTMADFLKECNVIKSGTVVEFLEPGDTRVKLPGASGIRFYVLGPPKDTSYLDLEYKAGGNYDKRESKSRVDFALVAALTDTGTESSKARLPFEQEFESIADTTSYNTKAVYETDGEWRKIDYDWLYSAGALAMRYEKSINNTSLALAIQFEESERILLFPGDAEFGNWESWQDGLEWPVKINGRTVKKNADYILEKTVFYKIGHHISQNGTSKGNGMEKMTSGELTAMGTLDFRKINPGWLNTMPNDLLGAEIIKKSEGKLLFTGEWEKILNNIKTDRVTVKKSHETTLTKLNKAFDKENLFVECEITG